MYRINTEDFLLGVIVYINKLDSMKEHFKQECYGVYMGGCGISTKRGDGSWITSYHYYRDEFDIVDDIEKCKEIEKDFVKNRR